MRLRFIIDNIDVSLASMQFRSARHDRLIFSLINEVISKSKGMVFVAARYELLVDE